MGAQQHVRVEIEGVMHRPGRVMAWDVERLEVVIVVFDLRAFGNAVADVGEELLDTFQGPGNRMQASGSLATARQGHVGSEEHTSELQSLMRISYAVFCLKKKKRIQIKARPKIK